MNDQKNLSDYTVTTQVEEISNIHVQGDIIPTHWYKALTFENGRPNFVAVTLLSNIIYWYTKTNVEDESTGQLVSYKKKCKGDFLQRSTKAFSKLFGFSQKQVTDALRYLEDKGYIKRHFRNISYGEGQVASNVQFIEIIPKAIENLHTIGAISISKHKENRFDKSTWYSINEHFS